MTHPLSVVPHAAVSMIRPRNMMKASWQRPQRRPILERERGLAPCKIYVDGELVPITKKPDQDLAANNTENLEVGDSIGPLLVAGLVFRPAAWPDGIKKRGQVANGEENVTTRSVSCGLSM